MVHEAVPHESPEVVPDPSTKFTARLKVVSPEPLEGEVQSTVHERELKLE
jgi:hypothetical protein